VRVELVLNDLWDSRSLVVLALQDFRAVKQKSPKIFRAKSLWVFKLIDLKCFKAERLQR
jgi:hypothetical protein